MYQKNDEIDEILLQTVYFAASFLCGPAWNLSRRLLENFTFMTFPYNHGVEPTHGAMDQFGI